MINNNEPIYSNIQSKPTPCETYCAANGYFSVCSDTPGLAGSCVDDEGVDCYTVEGRYCCCGL